MFSKTFPRINVLGFDHGQVMVKIRLSTTFKENEGHVKNIIKFYRTQLGLEKFRYPSTR